MHAPMLRVGAANRLHTSALVAVSACSSEPPSLDDEKADAGIRVKDLPACWREASLIRIFASARHHESEGGFEEQGRPMFLGES